MICGLLNSKTRSCLRIINTGQRCTPSVVVLNLEYVSSLLTSGRKRPVQPWNPAGLLECRSQPFSSSPSLACTYRQALPPDSNGIQCNASRASPAQWRSSVPELTDPPQRAHPTYCLFPSSGLSYQQGACHRLSHQSCSPNIGVTFSNTKLLFTCTQRCRPRAVGIEFDK